jgi:ubiquitin-conjugating enzyme E2 variant
MRAIETTSIGLFFVLLGFSVPGIEIPYWSIPLALIGGWLLADLFSGLVHWALDTYGSVRTPVLGPAIIRPFREHHADPLGMTRHDFIEVNGASCLGCLPLLGLSFLAEGMPHALLLFTCIGILFTNQCHKWAHMENPPSLVRTFQASGLILRASEHVKHHTPPYDSHFCTASGWLNRPLNTLLFRRKTARPAGLR